MRLIISGSISEALVYAKNREEKITVYYEEEEKPWNLNCYAACC